MNVMLFVTGQNHKTIEAEVLKYVTKHEKNNGTRDIYLATLPVNRHHFFFFSNLVSCLQIVLYLRMCLAHSAGATPVSKSLADMQDDAPAIGRYIHTLLSNQPLTSSSSTGTKGAEVNPVQVYMELLQQLLSAVGGE